MRCRTWPANAESDQAREVEQGLSGERATLTCTRHTMATTGGGAAGREHKRGKKKKKASHGTRRQALSSAPALFFVQRSGQGVSLRQAACAPCWLCDAGGVKREGARGRGGERRCYEGKGRGKREHEAEGRERDVTITLGNIFFSALSGRGRMEIGTLAREGHKASPTYAAGASSGPEAGGCRGAHAPSR